jgi:predicted RecA/RadA family phage recombinase
MASNYIQKGEVISATLAADVTSGQVVSIGAILGVVLESAAANQPTEIAITGVWRLPKVSTAGIALGDALYWDASAAAFTNTGTLATGDVSGVAWAAAPAASGATLAAVRLTGGVGTVKSA